MNAMSKSIAEFVSVRAEILAKVFLTRRMDIRLSGFGEGDEAGLDLMASITGDDGRLKGFGVQIEGTSHSLTDEREATSYCRTLSKRTPRQSTPYFPTIMLVFSVRDDRGYFDWIAEPRVVGNTPKLDFHREHAMSKLEPELLDEIVGRVIAWYDVLFGLLSLTA